MRSAERAEERALEIDAEHSNAPLLRRRRGNGAPRGYVLQETGVVHEDVDRTEVFDGEIEQRVDCGFARDVSREGKRVSARYGLSDFASRARRIEVVHDDPRALGAEALGDGLTDAVAGAGDDDNFVFRKRSRSDISELGRCW